MAISKLLHIKDTGSGFHGKHLKAGLNYITDPEKTKNGRLVSAVNCQTDAAFEQMKATKQKFGKECGRQAYHIILSFKEGEASPDTVFELTERFVKEYLGGDYETVFAVHDNTSHPHSHIIFNSVSFRDGKKFHYKKGDWEREIQPVTNRLCEEYGLSTIALGKEPGKRRKAPKEWSAHRDGKFVWSDMVRRDVDACILQAASYEGFLSMMEEKGYELKNAHGEGKYLSAKLPGMKRMIRLKTLGDGYTQENIRRRVREENLSQYRRHRKERPGIVYCKVKRYRRAKMSGLQKKYYARLYRIGRLKKKPYSAVWKYRDEIRKMQKLQAQYQFLVRNNIHSAADLALVKERLTDKKRTASAEKSRLYRADGRNRELYGIAGEMEKLLECENAYQNGDIFFEDEHSQWVSLENSLKKLGYSYDEVANLKGHYQSEAARLKDMEVAAAKELKLAESIRTDDTGTDRLETERKEDETMEQKKSTEWQPKR